MQIPGSLGALLAKMGLGGPLTEGKLGAKGTAEAKGLKSAHGTKEGVDGPHKGAELGPDGELLSGLGYAGTDKETAKKNVNEKTNVERFLQDSGVERPTDENPFSKLGEAAEHEAPMRETKDAKEPKEQREVRDAEVRRDEKDEARVVGQQQEAEAKEAKEAREADEPRPDRQQSRDEDEDDKPGAGWVAEELEADEKSSKRGIRAEDVLGAVSRCRGTLDDGTGCLRKPVQGTPYCREHAWPVVRPIEKA